jgi:A/G-specific adenine glycosylase
VCGTASALPRVTHTFTHFRLDITPLAIDVVERGAACMESPDLLWYKAAAPASVGLARPVADLLRAQE